MAKKKHNPSITAYEQALFEGVERKFDYNPFSRWFFQLSYSGTIYTPQDRAEEYAILHEAWRTLGKPDEEFQVKVDGISTTFKLMWGGYGDDPAILYPHGYLFLPWALHMLTTGKMICVAEGGTGSAKTSSVAIAALIKCAVFPGFDFLNVAPTTTQATDMMDEAAKWIEGSRFERFVVRTNQGELWKWKPYPIMTINAGLGTYSTFGCMTLGDTSKELGANVLGKGKDWLNVDEASLVQGIGQAIPALVTRYRGSRRNGVPRYSRPAFSLITNPHDNNPSFDVLKAQAIRETYDDKSLYYFVRPATRENVYITSQQIAVQKAMLDEEQQRRWMEGSDADFAKRGTIPTILIQDCISQELDDRLDAMLVLGDPAVIRHDAMGIIDYQLPFREGHQYLVWGDPGSSDLTSLQSNNVGTVGAFDLTGFPSKPATLVSARFISGGGRYQLWIGAMTEMMLKYRPMVSVYDATAMGKVFYEWPGWQNWPLYPVTLSGGNKAESKGLFLLFASAGLFSWPTLTTLKHQASAYKEGVKEGPDDLIAGLFVASYWIRFYFYEELAPLFNWDEAASPPDETDLIEQAYQIFASRYGHGTGGRYSRGGQGEEMEVALS